MNILFCGDIVGRSGRDIITQHIPRLKKELSLDCIIVNGENAAAGFGITEKICEEFLTVGINVITTGNHIWHNNDIISKIDRLPYLLRPINFPTGTPGKGIYVYETDRKQKVVVINVLGRLFMEPSLNDPFSTLTKELSAYQLGGNCHAIIVDIHAETTSEKMALAHFLDGQVSLVVGTHTHIPTADAQILPLGTAYQTDAGMCGDYNSVIGMKKDVPILRFTRKMPTNRLSPAEGEGTLCGVFLETDDSTGLAKHFSPLRLGARLKPCWPW